MWGWFKLTDYVLTTRLRSFTSVAVVFNAALPTRPAP
jgi:hypothetical protein